MMKNLQRGQRVRIVSSPDWNTHNLVGCAGRIVSVNNGLATVALDELDGYLIASPAMCEPEWLN